MRRTKKNSRFQPYIAGLAIGYAAALAAALVGSALMFITGSEGIAGAAAMTALAAGSFVSGRISGARRRRNGLATGALSGILYIIPLALLSIVFGVMSGPLLAVKLAVCTAFGAAGGVAGVNHTDA